MRTLRTTRQPPIRGWQDFNPHTNGPASAATVGMRNMRNTALLQIGTNERR